MNTTTKTPAATAAKTGTVIPVLTSLSGNETVRVNDSAGTLSLAPLALLRAYFFPPAPAYPVPTFTDNFTEPNWQTVQGNGGPPAPGAPGFWFRLLRNGWPTNSGSQDPAARTLSGSHDAECFEESCAQVSGSGLILTATRKPGVEFPQLPWQSGVVTSSLDHLFGFGYYEVVVIEPGETGFNSAVWMVPPPSYGWLYEVDLDEKPGVDTNGQPSLTTYHIGENNANNSSSNGAWAAGDLAGVKHKKGVLITPATTFYYLDDALVGQEPTPANFGQVGCCVIINLSVGQPGSWEGAPTVNSATMTCERFSFYAAGSWGSSTIPQTAPV